MNVFVAKSMLTNRNVVTKKTILPWLGKRGK